MEHIATSSDAYELPMDHIASNAMPTEHRANSSDAYALPVDHRVVDIGSGGKAHKGIKDLHLSAGPMSTSLSNGHYAVAGTLQVVPHAYSAALDPPGHHAMTCRHRRKAMASPDLLAGWGRGKLAALDITITSPFCPAILGKSSHHVCAAALAAEAPLDLNVIHLLNTDLTLEVSLASGNSAEVGEIGKHAKNDKMCARLGIPLVVEVYGGWGCETKECFSLSKRLAMQVGVVETEALS
eukprot:Em0006g719a